MGSYALMRRMEMVYQRCSCLMQDNNNAIAYGTRDNTAADCDPSEGSEWI